ncbi:DUF3896 family protein [Bacillus luteolus]|uniref:DUF3896 family protein n=1 Tax=Litchfieldia luteola TaxID=682179 RepID=A0ABR9QN87_9BACI|nr:DUF3896 family protein [Cytobacillus luteolus]MBE4909962.1 DUF3896 family protein [Cytobacillus luteolus]MBP1942481.1 hypothetical protein [Cytobacillus luteolus]
MDYKQVKEKLEASKMELIHKLQKPNLSHEEKDNLEKSIANIDYIIELTDMNHYERG